MAYNKKVWEDRVSENPTRRILTNVATGAEMVVDVARNEGEISQQGDAFDAATMNDLEDRIEEGLKDAASVVTGTKEEIESMLAQGLLKDGQQVVIEDDYVEGETIDELSDRVDALSENLAKHEIEPTFEKTIANHTLKLHRIGNMVTCDYLLHNGGSVITDGVLFYFPEGYKPKRTAYKYGTASSQSASGIQSADMFAQTLIRANDNAFLLATGAGGVKAMWGSFSYEVADGQ